MNQAGRVREWGGGASFAPLRTALLVWGFEIILIRITALPLRWTQAMEAAIPWLFAAAVAAVAARAAPASRFWSFGVAFLACGAPMGLAASILVPVAIVAGTPSFVCVVVSLGIAWSIAARSCSRSPERFPSPIAALALLFAAVAATWWLDPDPLPALSIVSVAAVVWTALATLARRRLVLVVVAVLGFAISVIPAGPFAIHFDAGGPPPAGPDVLLISMDTMRADTAVRMESYRRLASDGLRFDNAQSAAPWTLPSMATAMSGQPVPVHRAMSSPEGIAGLGEWPRPSAIAPEVPLLAERLRDIGYDTAAIVALNTLLTSRFGFDRGFSVFWHPVDMRTHPLPRGVRMAEVADSTMSRVSKVAMLRLGITLPSVADVGAEPHAATVVDHAVRVIEHRRDRPLFLWVHFMDVHLPYFHALELSAVGGEDRHGEKGPWGPEGRKAYEAETDFLDRHIMRLLDAVFASAKSREKFVALIADHGEEFLDHGHIGHGHTFYDELIRIPLVVAGDAARERAGTAVSHAVGVIDLVPTVLEVVGAADASLPGQNLLKEIEARPYIATALASAQYGSSLAFARREGKWKAIVVPGAPVELYDLEADPEETRDLAKDHPDWVTYLSRPAAEAAVVPSDVVPADLTHGEKERLRQLGYDVE